MNRKLSPVLSLLALSLLGACAGSRGPAPRAPAPPPPGSSGTDATAQGISLYEQGRYAEAEAVLVTAAGARARAYLAASRVKLKKYQAAEAPALEALAASPADPVAAGALGESLVSQGRLDEAIARLSAVIGTDPAVAYAYYWRGQARQRQGHVARMAEDYEAFLKLAPDAPEAPAVRVLLGSLQ